MKVQVTLLSKQPPHAEVVAEGERDLELWKNKVIMINYVLETNCNSGDCSLSSNPCDQLQT